MKTLTEKFDRKFIIIGNGGCWIWIASIMTTGYGCIGTGKPGCWKTELSHRVSWKLHNGPIPDDMFVCHHCDNRLCVNPDHLFLGTPADNVADMVLKNRNHRGEKTGTSKLTDGDIEKMFLLKSALKQYEIAKIFNIGGGQTSMVLNGKSRSRRTDGTPWL